MAPRCDSPADYQEPVTEPTAIDALYARCDDYARYECEAKSDSEAEYWYGKLTAQWALIRASVPLPEREARKPR